MNKQTLYVDYQLPRRQPPDRQCASGQSQFLVVALLCVSLLLLNSGCNRCCLSCRCSDMRNNCLVGLARNAIFRCQHNRGLLPSWRLYCSSSNPLPKLLPFGGCPIITIRLANYTNARSERKMKACAPDRRPAMIRLRNGDD